MDRFATKSHEEWELLSFDNEQISTSDFVEQREDGPAKMTCGTFMISYPLRLANKKSMLLSAILDNQKSLRKINFNQHVRPSFGTMLKINAHGIIHIVNTILESDSFDSVDYVEHVKTVRKSPILIHRAILPPPPDHVTIQRPGQSISIPENSVSDIIKVIEDIFLRQKRMDPQHDMINKYAVLSINDQATNALLRSARATRIHDETPFARFDSIQLAPGMFHFLLNLSWIMLSVHRSHKDDHGSAQLFINVMGKKRHGKKHPDYHAIKATLMQILDGILLEAW